MASLGQTDKGMKRWPRPVVFVSGWRNHLRPGSCPVHGHDCIEVVYHPGGRGWTEMSGGVSFDFGPGDVVVYPAYCDHVQTLTGSGEDVVVQFSVTGMADPVIEPFMIGGGQAEALVHDITLLANPPAFRGELQQATFDLRSGALLAALLDATVHPSAGGEVFDYAEQAYRLIGERYADLLSVSDLAKEVGISYDHLRHCFKARYARSLQECLIGTRIDRARELLRQSTLPLKAIAPLCGFGTDRHLCSVFRSQVGLTPGAYRKRKKTQ